MMKKTYRDQGIVLRTHDLGEADRIITLFTRNHGKVRAVAKGVRKTKSRYGARLEPFSYIDVQLYQGRNLDVVSQVESITPYHKAIITNYEVYAAASGILETANRLLVVEKEADLGHFVLLHGALHAIAVGAHHPELILYSYILRAMSYAGWQLAINECAVCGAESRQLALNLELGGTVCESCSPLSTSFLAPETRELLAALSVGNWEVADKSSVKARKNIGALVTAYLHWHLEQQLQSIKVINSKLLS